MISARIHLFLFALAFSTPLLAVENDPWGPPLRDLAHSRLPKRSPAVPLVDAVHAAALSLDLSAARYRLLLEENRGDGRPRLFLVLSDGATVALSLRVSDVEGGYSTPPGAEQQLISVGEGGLALIFEADAVDSGLAKGLALNATSYHDARNQAAFAALAPEMRGKPGMDHASHVRVALAVQKGTPALVFFSTGDIRTVNTGLYTGFGAANAPRPRPAAASTLPSPETRSSVPAPAPTPKPVPTVAAAPEGLVRFGDPGFNIMGFAAARDAVVSPTAAPGAVKGASQTGIRYSMTLQPNDITRARGGAHEQISEAAEAQRGKDPDAGKPIREALAANRPMTVTVEVRGAESRIVTAAVGGSELTVAGPLVTAAMRAAEGIPAGRPAAVAMSARNGVPAVNEKTFPVGTTLRNQMSAVQIRLADLAPPPASSAPRIKVTAYTAQVAAIINLLRQVHSSVVTQVTTKNGRIADSAKNRALLTEAGRLINEAPAVDNRNVHATLMAAYRALNELTRR